MRKMHRLAEEGYCSTELHSLATPAVWYNEVSLRMKQLVPSSRKKCSHMTMDRLISGT